MDITRKMSLLASSCGERRNRLHSQWGCKCVELLGKSRVCSSNCKWNCLEVQQFHYWSYIQRKWNQYVAETRDLLCLLRGFSNQPPDGNGMRAVSVGWAVHAEGMWILDRRKWGKWAGTSISLPLLPDCGCHVTSWSRFPDRMDRTPRLSAKINPSSPKLISSASFVTVTGKERRQGAKVLGQVCSSHVLWLRTEVHMSTWVKREGRGLTGPFKCFQSMLLFSTHPVHRRHLLLSVSELSWETSFYWRKCYKWTDLGFNSLWSATVITTYLFSSSKILNDKSCPLLPPWFCLLISEPSFSTALRGNA